MYISLKVFMDTLKKIRTTFKVKTIKKQSFILITLFMNPMREDCA